MSSGIGGPNQFGVHQSSNFGGFQNMEFNENDPDDNSNDSVKTAENAPGSCKTCKASESDSDGNNSAAELEVKEEKEANYSKSRTSNQQIRANFNRVRSGIGGFDHELNTIFRRAFASRIIPQEIAEELGIVDCRGMLLFGPPGTGKSLIARKIGQHLTSREPKICNAPEVLDRFVGNAEKKIRELFAEAEEESERFGQNSSLHVIIIIIDEIDAIAKRRNQKGSNDTIVNQLLAKLDGIQQLNNIFMIGTTNRKEIVDEALLRPGRLELQIEIGLPNEKGRLEILQIHTLTLRELRKIDSSIDFAQIAKKTTNYTGAELEGLVRAAQSNAIMRVIDTQRENF